MSKSGKTSLISWFVRIAGLAVMASCFIVNEGINHVEFKWYQKLAWTLVFSFGFLGSITWIRSTYTEQELKVNPTLTKIVWVFAGGIMLIAMIVFLFGRIFSE